MMTRLHLVVAALFSLAFGGLAVIGSPARRGDTEEGLLARLERERNPVKRAKFEIRLGRLKLLQAIEAYDQRDREQGQQLLSAYLERMKSAWATLEGSGRQAYRRPQGFKELDIALRQDGRLLEDLAHRVPFHDRSPVEKAAQEVEELRSRVLKALFPSERPRQRGSRFLSLSGPHISPEMVRG